jgi:putative CocE/NonD family hydrolase
MKAVSTRIEREVIILMRDGTRLRADIYRPDDRRRHPAIFIRTPYNKRLNTWRHNSFLDFLEAVRRGYAVIMQDVRGRFASDGHWGGSDVFQHEGQDGYDSVEWIAAQKWSDGNVGMSGISALSALQWLTAMENPPHLRAIAPGCGGMPNLGVGMQPRWGSGAVSPAVLLSSIPSNSIEVANRLEKAGQDVSEMRQAIDWIQSNPELAVNFLPLKDLPLLKFEHARNTWLKLIQPVPQAEREKQQRYEKVMVPCFHIGGWYDALEWAVIESFTQMRQRGGSPASRRGQHLLVGPWWHLAWVDSLGALNFGSSADVQKAMVSDYLLAFYDRYLMGKDIPLPAVRYFAMSRNRWQEAEDWPLLQIQWQRFYLNSRGHANGAVGDGVLTRAEPHSQITDTFSYNPLQPVPTVGGRFFGIGLVPGPLDQYQVEKRPDVLCYTTPELTEDVEITGSLEVHLFASTSAPDTDFSAKLVDVHPDGLAYNLVEGIKRARALKSVEHPQPIVPGKVFEYVILLGETSQVFRRGHRIRLEISSSNFPMFDRNMNTGHGIGEDAAGPIALQTVYHQTGFASYIELPVIPAST